MEKANNMAEYEARSRRGANARHRQYDLKESSDSSSTDTKTNKRKRRWSDYDSYNDTSLDEGQKSGSRWKRSKLEALNVFYAKNPISPTEILEMLKSCNSVDKSAYCANVMTFFQCLLEKKMTFSQDVGKYENLLHRRKTGGAIAGERKDDVVNAFEEMKTVRKKTEQWLFSNPDLTTLLKEFHIDLISEEWTLMKRLVDYGLLIGNCGSVCQSVHPFTM